MIRKLLLWSFVILCSISAYLEPDENRIVKWKSDVLYGYISSIVILFYGSCLLLGMEQETDE